MGESASVILCKCLLRPMCPVMRLIAVRYRALLLLLECNTFIVFLELGPMNIFVCSCAFLIQLSLSIALTFLFISVLMYLVGMRLSRILSQDVPIFACSSAFSLPH